MRKIIVLSLAVLLAFTSCQSMDDSPSGTVSVSGSGSVSVEPDMASFSVSIEQTAETTAEAQSQTNARMEKVYSILHDEYGIPAEDIRTTGMSMYPEYRYEDGVQILIGQTSSQSASVTVRNLDDLARIVDSLSAVTGISLSSISLDASDREAVRNEARLLAVQNALEKAKLYAEAAGMSLGDAVTISENGSYYASNRIQPVLLSAAAKDESSLTSSASFYAGDLEVSADVNVTFEMY